MSCKIRVDKYNKEAGKLNYLMMTQDAASLEARVATSDTALNPEGIDPVLSSVYDPKAGLGEDLHSMTGFNVFCGSINMQVNEITDENGKVWLCLDNGQNIYIEREGKKMLVEGKDIKETDKILGYPEDLD